MIYLRLTKRILPILLTVSTVVHANEFADDFSADSIRFSVNSLDDASGIYSAMPTSDGLALSASTDDANVAASVFVDIQDSSDTIGMDFTHLSTSSGDAIVFSGIEASLYSDNPDSSRENGDGTVTARIGFEYDQDRNPSAVYCMHDAVGNIVQVDNACGRFDELTLSMDEKASFDIALDRDTSQVTFTVNGVSKVVDIPGEIFDPGDDFRRIQLYSEGAAVSADAILHAVRIGDEEIDMAASPPVFDRYYTGFDTGATVALENEKVAVTAVSVAEDDRWTNAGLGIRQPTDYLEAELTLSSSSTVSEVAHRVWAGMSSNLYNTEADGGIDGRLGDVKAELNMEARGDGQRAIELCLFRYDDAEGDARTGLLDPDNPDNRCDDLPFILEFDTPYRVVLGLDRESSEFFVRLNGYTRKVPLSSDFFTAAESNTNVTIASRNNGIAVGTIDNVRTVASALTASEQAAGASVPAAFPDPIDPESLAVDSTIEHLFDFSDTETQLDFVDDFGGISSDFGFWSGRERGGSGISWDGEAVVFETNSAVDNDDGNWTEFYLDPNTDNVEAVVSLSGDTRLSVDSEAEIQLRAIFYNDTQDFGFNDQEGDMEAALRLQVEGNGRRRLRVDLRRRDADGRTDGSVLEEITEFEEGLGATVPMLDTQYKFSLAIDRDNGVLRFGLDDEVTEYQIPSGVFLPSQRRVLISVNHNGSSGVSVGKIHSIKTDTIDEDFSLAAPEIAPYRPTFNAQYPGRLVQAIDGRVRLEADGSLVSGRDPRIVALLGSDYVGATIELSSESVLQPDGTVFVGVSGTMYNDLAEGVDREADSNEGNVFAAVRLTAEGEGERYVQTCAWRGNNSDFSDATELLSGSTEVCARFPDIVPEFDVAYPAFVKLDRIDSTLTFGFNGETVIYNIATAINSTGPFHGVRARTSDGSKVVAWADDLSFAENPVPLAESANRLTVDDGVAGGDTNSDGSTESTESSGGGSISAGLLLSLYVIAGIFTRRRLQNYK